MVHKGRSLMHGAVLALGLLVFVLALSGAPSVGASHYGTGPGWYGPDSYGCFVYSDGFEDTDYFCPSDPGTLSADNGDSAPSQSSDGGSTTIPESSFCDTPNHAGCPSQPELINQASEPWTQPNCYDSEHYENGGVC